MSIDSTAGSIVTSNRQYYVQAVFKKVKGRRELQATGQFMIVIYDKPPRRPSKMGYLGTRLGMFCCRWMQKNALVFDDAGSANTYLQENATKLK